MYYKYTKQERRSKDREKFDPKDPHIQISDLQTHLIGPDPLISDLWNDFEIALTSIIAINTLLCLVTTCAAGDQVTPHFARLLRPLFFLVKFVNVYVRPCSSRKL